MMLELNTITKCYFTEDISGDISLNKIDLTANLCPSDVDHIFRLNVNGLFYPVFPQSLLKRQLVGYFIDEENNEFIYIYKDDKKYIIDETIGDLGWLPFKG